MTDLLTGCPRLRLEHLYRIESSVHSLGAPARELANIDAKARSPSMCLRIACRDELNDFTLLLRKRCKSRCVDRSPVEGKCPVTPSEHVSQNCLPQWVQRLAITLGCHEISCTSRQCQLSWQHSTNKTRLELAP